MEATAESSIPSNTEILVKVGIKEGIDRAGATSENFENKKNSNHPKKGSIIKVEPIRRRTRPDAEDDESLFMSYKHYGENMKIIILIFLLPLVFFVLVSCKLSSRENSSVSSFKPLRILSEKKIIKDFKLPLVDKKSEELNINYQAYEYQAYPLDEDDIGITVNLGAALEVVFGSLTEPQFNYLKHSYGHSLSKIIYNPSKKDYRLRDFLPPMMSAVIDKRFEMSSVSTICYSTVYEALRKDSENLVAFAGFKPDVYKIFTDKKFSTKITKEQILKPLDVVIYNSDLGHVEILIDETVVFEKYSAESIAPYKLRYIGDQYKSSKRPPYEFRRFTQNGLPFPVKVIRTRFVGDTDDEFTDYQLIHNAMPLLTFLKLDWQV